VPTLLIKPKSKQGPFPLVVILPGGDGRKDNIVESTAYQSAYTNDLTEKGYAVFSLDVQFHGERKGNNNYRESLFRNKQINGWRNLVVQTVIDVRRALDYLDTRTEIDVSRVGCIGGSMGGLLTFALTAVEDRISVSVSSVGLPWSQNLWKGFEWDDMPFVQSVIGPQNFAPRINDRPFLMMMATQDRHYSVEDSEELFRLVNSTKKQIIWFESEHSLPRDQQTTSALNWIYEYL
jgi:dienelactone hydrolase